MDIIVPLLANVLLAVVAYFKKSVSISGALMGITAGFCIFFFGGIISWIILVALFSTTAVLSKFKKETKLKLQEHWYPKDEKRDIFQVAANIGPGTIFLVLYYITKNPAYIAGFCGSFAASTADTCSSEMGVLSSRTPVSIITFRKMEPGESGGVTLFGTIFGALGSLIIATFAILYKDFNYKVIIIIFLAGLIGSIIDSILGDFAQVKYICSDTGKMTERSSSNGKKNKVARGLIFINNDIVNYFCTISGGLVATGFYFLIFFMS